MDLNIYDYKTALDLDFTLTKAERLQVRFQAPVASSRSACRSSLHRRLHWDLCWGEIASFRVTSS